MSEFLLELLLFFGGAAVVIGLLMAVVWLVAGWAAEDYVKRRDGQ